MTESVEGMEEFVAEMREKGQVRLALGLGFGLGLGLGLGG